jgi:hypothetical protein
MRDERSCSKTNDGKRLPRLSKSLNAEIPDPDPEKASFNAIVYRNLSAKENLRSRSSQVKRSSLLYVAYISTMMNEYTSKKKKRLTIPEILFRLDRICRAIDDFLSYIRLRGETVYDVADISCRYVY